jgi:uncharacterized protein (DUF58 family)
LARHTVPEGIRITKVGLWYILLTVLIAVPAANTGNNALYMVEACLLALLIVSGFTSRQNLRKVEVELSAPTEVYANQPFSLSYRIRQRGRLWGRRLLVIAGVGEGKPVLIRHLSRREEQEGALELTARRRGRLRIPYLHLSSIYPLGLFRKGMRHRVEVEVLIFPALLPTADYRFDGGGFSGDRPARRAGAGHELLTLRSFRPGDDRRGIHWKQSARTGGLIYMEREAERGQRVSIQFDNAVGELADPDARERFERLVSEAATAVHHFIEQAWEVELITRGEVIGFGRGRGHRYRMLEALALVGPVAHARGALAGTDPGAPALRFGFGVDLG